MAARARTGGPRLRPLPPQAEEATKRLRQHEAEAGAAAEEARRKHAAAMQRAAAEAEKRFEKLRSTLEGRVKKLTEKIGKGDGGGKPDVAVRKPDGRKGRVSGAQRGTRRARADARTCRADPVVRPSRPRMWWRS